MIEDGTRSRFLITYAVNTDHSCRNQISRARVFIDVAHMVGFLNGRQGEIHHDGSDRCEQEYERGSLGEGAVSPHKLDGSQDPLKHVHAPRGARARE